MVKRRKFISSNERLKLKKEIIVDTVNEIFRNHPKDFASKVVEFDFEYYEEEDFDAIEENAAKPENRNQLHLIDYFENGTEVSEKIFEIFSAEKCADHPNYLLLRRYFKEANQNLKALLLYGLNRYPGRIDLLSDLAFFHEFENIFNILIIYYTSACLMQGNLETFAVLAKEFYYTTVPDGYNALYALRDLFPSGTEKRSIIDFLTAAKAEAEDDEGCKADFH